MDRIRNRINQQLDQANAPIDKQLLWDSIKQDDRFPRKKKKKRFFPFFILLSGIGLGVFFSVLYFRSTAYHYQPITTPSTIASIQTTEAEEYCLPSTVNEIPAQTTNTDLTTAAVVQQNTTATSAFSIQPMREEVGIALQATNLLPVTSKTPSIPTLAPLLLNVPAHKKVNPKIIPARKTNKWAIGIHTGIGITQHQFSTSPEANEEALNFQNNHSRSLPTQSLGIQIERQFSQKWGLALGIQHNKHTRVFEHSHHAFSGYVPNPDTTGPSMIYSDTINHYTLYHYHYQTNALLLLKHHQQFSHFAISYGLGMGIQLQQQTKGQLLSPSNYTLSDLAIDREYGYRVSPFVVANIQLEKRILPYLVVITGINIQTPSVLTIPNAKITHKTTPILFNVGLKTSL